MSVMPTEIYMQAHYIFFARKSEKRQVVDARLIRACFVMLRMITQFKDVIRHIILDNISPPTTKIHLKQI